MMQNNCLRSLIEIAEPIDPHTHRKETFFYYIDDELEKKFNSMCTEEFMLSIKERGVYFIVDYIKKKYPCNDSKVGLRLRYCCKEELPTIVLNIYTN